MNIPIPDKSSWPETADGTTDWDALFNDEDNGLFAVVSGAQTPVQLKQQTEIIIRRIFTRDNDRPVINKVMAALDRMIPDDATEDRLPVMRAGVIKMLGKARDVRIKRAAAYVAEKEKQPESEITEDISPGGNDGLIRKCLDSLALVPVAIVQLLAARKAVADRRGMEQTTEENVEETYFQSDAYVDHGDDNTEWQDNDLHAMKEKDGGVFKDDEEAKKADDDEEDSWDNY